MVMNRYIKRFFIFVALLTVLVSFWKFNSYENEKFYSAEDSLTVRFLDVGQADCEVIQFPDGRNVMIDAGGRQTAGKVVDKLKTFGIEKIDYIIATHPHEDHIGGMSEIIDSFEIGTVYMPDAVSSTKVFEDMLDSIETKNADVKQAKAGVVIIDEQGVKMEFVAPVGDNYNDKNNFSAVLKLKYYKRAFLFTGDAEGLSEKEMLDNGAYLGADVLKVGHHGSDSSTGEDFLNAVNPKYAVIEVGTDNTYGHPDTKILERLKYTILYRTDIHGDITFVCDGENISVSTKYSED